MQIEFVIVDKHMNVQLRSDVDLLAEEVGVVAQISQLGHDLACFRSTRRNRVVE